MLFYFSSIFLIKKHQICYNKMFENLKCIFSFSQEGNANEILEANN